ncbi:MAG TPA: 2Fe-2S iron-sulfur cluster-binding protein, partial [Jiangellaceae bacterium]
MTVTEPTSGAVEPAEKLITVTIDGFEVSVPEGTLVIRAAELLGIQIPRFCDHPLLDPVGACRQCLVEIVDDGRGRGMPKPQASCTTAVMPGMVVKTQLTSPIADKAQQGIMEFLLINHPLDCPVCDKGGECPLQDIAFGWGPGRSRFIEPKRHFVKPLALSPLIAIDRERCILCYRCVRFSQEISEDYQLVLQERGAHTYVATFDGHPYVAPFSGNIIELCPVGALTSQEYRFRARPWDIEDAGTICTLCPSQCNVKLTVRDEQVARVLARDNPAVDDGWLCDKGRFGFQMISSPDRPTSPLIREGGALREASWDEAIEIAGSRLRGPRAAALIGGASSNEEGWIAQRLIREGGSEAVASG